MPDSLSSLHQPVLCEAVLKFLSPLADKTIVDGTLGLGGHAHMLLSADASVRVIGIDRDADALALASSRLACFGDRLQTVHGNYRELDQHLDGLGVDRIDGLLLDLGVSSLHLDTSERGFSFRRDGPLDMRMDRDELLKASDWIRTATESELSEIIFRFGEERYGRRIARAIVAARDASPIDRTLQLADIIRRAVPAQYDHRRLHPATRTFQAIRMFLNDELGGLEAGLAAGFERLAVGGVAVVISFHSLEDRIVKRFFREKAQSCVCPPKMPVCVCGKKIEANILTQRPVIAAESEVADNPRARSAKLRAAERL